MENPANTDLQSVLHHFAFLTRSMNKTLIFHNPIPSKSPVQKIIPSTKVIPMKRRNFIQTTVATATASALTNDAFASGTPKLGSRFSLDQNRVKIYIPDFQKSVKVLFVSDTHLWMDDQRGEPYTQYSGRMAKAYNKTLHFQTGQPTHPNESFEKIIALAKTTKIDLLALPGDLFSFPSEAAIEWASNQLRDLGVPYQYAAGNHDWHYEGMAGSRNELRKQWSEKRPMAQECTYEYDPVFS
jgi:hypothetical protein